MASKKIAATVEEPLLMEIEERMKKEKFYETSEFVKHCIRQYLIKAPGGILGVDFRGEQAVGGHVQSPCIN